MGLYYSKVNNMRKGQTIVARYSGSSYLNDMNKDMAEYYSILDVVNVSYAMQVSTVGVNYALVLYRKI